MSKFSDGLADEVVDVSIKSAKSPLGAVADLLKRSGIDPDAIDSLDKVRIGEYQQMYKDEEGEGHIVDLKRTSLVLTPSWEKGPAWPLIDQAKPVKVSFSGTVRKVEGAANGMKRAVVLPDPQFGFLRDMKGELHPFHDRDAVAACITFLRATKPDVIVLLGDTMDLPVMSKFKTHPAYEAVTQPAIQECHDWLAAIRAACPDAEIVMLEGNHDLRMQDYVMLNAKAAFGLKRAGDPPEEWPVLTVPYLLRVEDLGINYVPGYPVARYEMAPNLVAIHGRKLKLSQTITDERICTLQGHTHHAAIQYFQFRSDKATKQQRWAASPGCLCRTDGSVPGYNHAIDPRSHQPVENPQDWQQGVGVVEYHEDGSTTPIYEHAPIEGGVLRWRGREFTGSL